MLKGSLRPNPSQIAGWGLLRTTHHVQVPEIQMVDRIVEVPQIQDAAA